MEQPFRSSNLSFERVPPGGLIEWDPPKGLIELVKCPINRVPTEILCRVFLHTVRFPYSTFDPSYLGPHRTNLVLLRISAVCRHWRSIALECATLWTNIAFSTSMLSTIRCARLFLSRSKNAALSVYVWDSGHAENLKIARSSKKLLKTISTQAHRISTCQLSSPSPDFWRCWVAPAPNLRKLLLQGHGPEVPPVFRGEFPLLEALFSQYCTTWPLGNYATLTHVELRNHSHHTSLTSLLDTLRGCVVLEGLVLDGYAFVVQEPPLLTPICLPRLKQIDLQTSDSALILGHLEVPSLRGPVVILNSTSRRHILQALPANQHNTPYLQGITSLHVDLSTRSSYHCVAGFRGDGSTAVYLGIYGVSSRERSSWAQLSFTAIAFFSPFFNIRTISLVTDAPAVPWELWLPNLACVEELTASCPRPDGLLAALLASSPENALPLLRNLTVYRRGRYSVVDHTALMQFVLHRYRIARPLRQLRLNREEWGWIQRLDETWVLLAQSQDTDKDSVTISLTPEVDLNELSNRTYMSRSGGILLRSIDQSGIVFSL